MNYPQSDREPHNPADSETLFGLLERWRDAKTVFEEDTADIKSELRNIRRIHGAGPHAVAPGVFIIITRSGKPKQV